MDSFWKQKHIQIYRLIKQLAYHLIEIILKIVRLEKKKTRRMHLLL